MGGWVGGVFTFSCWRNNEALGGMEERHGNVGQSHILVVAKAKWVGGWVVECVYERL